MEGLTIAQELIGAVIANEYRLDALITSVPTTSRAQVFRATHLSTEETLAIKMLLPEVEALSKYRRRFEREIIAATKMAHPNIVRVPTVGYFNDTPYLVMEFVPLSLRQLLAQKPTLSEGLAVNIIDQICQALDYAYSQGVTFHRDIKPDNILLTQDLTVKLAEFGVIGTTGTAIIREGIMVGTRHYMSPEQLRGKPLDQRSDLYVVGCILYEILTGTPLVTTGDSSMTSPLREELSAQLRALPGLTSETEQALLTLLAKDPADRFVSPLQLARSLVKPEILTSIFMPRTEALANEVAATEPLPQVEEPAAILEAKATAIPPTVEVAPLPAKREMPPAQYTGPATIEETLVAMNEKPAVTVEKTEPVAPVLPVDEIEEFPVGVLEAAPVKREAPPPPVIIETDTPPAIQRMTPVAESVPLSEEPPADIIASPVVDEVPSPVMGETPTPLNRTSPLLIVNNTVLPVANPPAPVPVEPPIEQMDPAVDEEEPVMPSRLPRDNRRQSPEPLVDSYCSNCGHPLRTGRDRCLNPACRAEARTTRRSAQEPSEPVADSPILGRKLAVIPRILKNRITATLVVLAIVVVLFYQMAPRRLGDLTSKCGLQALAITCYKRAAHINPHDAQAHLALARYFQQRKYSTLMMTEYRAALQAQPDMPEALIALADAAINEGQLKDAEYYYQQVQQQQPRHNYATECLAWLQNLRNVQEIPFTVADVEFSTNRNVPFHNPLPAGETLYYRVVVLDHWHKLRVNCPWSVDAETFDWFSTMEQEESGNRLTVAVTKRMAGENQQKKIATTLRLGGTETVTTGWEKFIKVKDWGGHISLPINITVDISGKTMWRKTVVVRGK